VPGLDVSQEKDTKMNIRKDHRQLTSQEKAAFVAALVELKTNGNPASGRNYDTFVHWHHQAMQFAHQGPSFLPWHREFLRLLEVDLQAVSNDPSLTIPYWNWANDNSPTSSLWHPSFMGGNGRPSDGVVETGAFSHANGWILSMDGPELKRELGVNAANLPLQQDMDDCLALSVYDVAPWTRQSDTSTSFRCRLEGWGPNPPHLHNQVHVWVGGSMLLMSSPNDPVFFLHHCNVDRIWAMWQDADPAHGYLPTNPVPGRPSHSLNESLAVFANGSTNASVLDYRSLGYVYDTSPPAPVHPLAAPESAVIRSLDVESSPYLH
jgi:tyrosinase